MNAIMLVNENLCFKGLSKFESRKLQLDSLKTYLNEHQLNEIALNPYQLYPYYTIPHALIYDVQQANKPLDYLLVHSQEIIQPFINVYPARWILLKSYFQNTIFIEKDPLLVS
jgi:hypothetical protein